MRAAKRNERFERIDAITIGARNRDMGDLGPLAASMAEIGLLQEIGITPDGTLIWGERRLRAAKLLGWTDIEAKIINIYSIARGEYPATRYADLFSRYRHNDKWDCHGDEAPPYDANADFAGSLNDCYAAIRARVAAGGEGWKPK